MDKLKIKEAIVVEGRDDTAVLRQVTDALIIETHGFGIAKSTWELLEKAYKEKGLIVLTDPDFSGEEIRKRIVKAFPDCKHAYMPRKKAIKKGDIGIENATPEDVKKVLEKVCTVKKDAQDIFILGDLDKAGLIGTPEAKELREKVGAILGIGYGNGNAMLKKLNSFGITREDFEKAVEESKR
ncbi:MAG: ribonuclease M5 [Firmicutes bacterium]|nr:ribonuclease M5 [Bacillota bacterium]